MVQYIPCKFLIFRKIFDRSEIFLIFPHCFWKTLKKTRKTLPLKLKASAGISLVNAKQIDATTNTEIVVPSIAKVKMAPKF